MLHQVQKLLCYTIILALLNASFQPLYAVHISSNEPLENSSLEDPHRSRPRLLVLEDFLQEKAKASANGIQTWTPDFIKNPFSRVYNGVCSWLASTVMDIAPSILAKTPFEIDYAHDLNYWQAHFSSALNEMQQEDVTQTSVQERLLDLQGIVFSQLLSPYTYERGIQSLQDSHPNAETVASLETLRADFKALLKSYPGFVEESFRRDAAIHIQNLQGKTPDPQDFMHLLHYYKDITNPFDYKQVLSDTRTRLQQNKKQLNLTVKDYQAILATTNQETGQLRKEARKLTKINRYSFTTTLTELPYFGEDVFEDTFNSALPSVGKEEAREKSFSIMSPFKGMARLAYKGMRYAVEHPVQAITIGLATQVAAAAAFRAFKVPTKSQTNDAANQKEPESNKRNVKRAIGDEFYINQNTASAVWPWTPSVASLTNGNAFVAWFKIQTNFEVYGRLFFSNGTAISNEFGIPQITSGSQETPSVASLTSGNMFVAWESDQTGDYDIYGRHFSPSGTAISNDFRINQVTTSHQQYPLVASLTNGNVFVAWSGLQTGNYDIYGRVFSPSGTAISNEFGINQITTADQPSPSVASLSNGNVFVAWHGNQYGNWDIYGRVFFPNGVALGNEFGINQITTADQTSPSVASLSNGNVFVAWHGNQAGNNVIYGRLISPSGTAISNEFTINQNTTNTQSYPSVASLTNGNVFVAWQGNQAGNNVIYGRLISPSGTAISNEFGINQITTSTQQFPSVASLTNGNVFVAWQGDQTGILDIYGRVFTNDTLASFILPSTTGTTGMMTTGRSSTGTTGMMTTGRSSTGTTGMITTGRSSTGTTGMMTTGTTSLASTTDLSMTTHSPPITSSTSTTDLSSTTSSPTDRGSNSNPSGSNLAAIIGGGVGGVALLTVGGVIVKKRCFSKKQPRGSEPHLELGFFPSSTHASISPFSPTSSGFTEHPSFVGALKNRTYAIWKELSEAEARLLQPYTAKKISSLYSSANTIPFVLGKGNYGATYAGSDLQTEELYAIKEVYGRKAVDESLREGELQDELKGSSQVMSLVDYKYYEPTKDTEQPRLFQVMPLAYTNGVGYKEMFSLLKEKDGAFHEKLIVDNFQQLMTGLAYMHTQGICHLDIKDENILYMRDGSLRIADFGRARKLGNNDQISDTRLGDRRKFSPEILAFMRSSWKKDGEDTGEGETAESFSGKAADTWAGGLYILELWLNENPFSDLISYRTKVLSWTNASFEEVFAGIKPLQEGSPDRFQGILRDVLAVNFKERMMPAQAAKKLSSFKALPSEERTKAFDRLIVLGETQRLEKKSFELSPFIKGESSNVYSSDNKEENKNYTYNGKDYN